MASRSDCVSCDKTVTNRQHALQSERCSKWQHRLCDSGVSFSDYKLACKGELELLWHCKQCSSSRKRKNVKPTETESNNKRQRNTSPAPVLESTRLSTTFSAYIPPVHVSVNTEDDIATDMYVPTNNDISTDQDEFGSYVIPQPAEESSMAEPIPMPVSQPETVTFTIITQSTERGSKTLVDSRGYSYTVKRAGKLVTNWRCSIRNKNMYCKATVSETNSQFIEGAQPHCHPAVMGLERATQIKAKLQLKVVDNHFQSAADIVDEAVNDAMPKKDNLVRTANRRREKTRPKHPNTLDFSMQQKRFR